MYWIHSLPLSGTKHSDSTILTAISGKWFRKEASPKIRAHFYSLNLFQLALIYFKTEALVLKHILSHEDLPPNAWIITRCFTKSPVLIYIGSEMKIQGLVFIRDEDTGLLWIQGGIGANFSSAWGNGNSFSLASDAAAPVGLFRSVPPTSRCDADWKSPGLLRAAQDQG